jgi:anti-anti-sigma factor
MESGLAIDVREVAGVPDASRVSLNGPLDARSVGAFKTAIQSLQNRGVKRFILNLSEVKYVNSTGLSFLINLSESLGQGRAAVTLVGLQPKVKIVFDTMGVTDFFRTASSIDEAVKAIRKEPAPRPGSPPKTVPRTAPRPPSVSSAPAVKREDPSGKTGRVTPPTSHDPPPSKHFMVRLFRRLFRRTQGSA